MSERGNINQFRARIEIETHRRQWSLSEFARRVGRTPQSLNDVMMRNNPRLDIIVKFAEVFEMTVDDFLVPITVRQYGAEFIPKFNG